jgi:hypothetical protein
VIIHDKLDLKGRPYKVALLTSDKVPAGFGGFVDFNVKIKHV